MAVSEEGFIENVNVVAANLDEIVQAVTLFDPLAVDAIKSISGLDMDTVIEDLNKGNYLGNRKIDIDLTLNNSSDVTNVAYQQADVMLQDGTYINIPFYTIPGDDQSGITELTSHADIKNYIANDTTFIALSTFTELTVEPAVGLFPEVIRFRDADGQSSNVDKVTLTVFSGTPVETYPNYFWANTTSSLQTIANRVSDIIKLGNNIDDIIALSIISDDIAVLVAIEADITTVATVSADVTSVADTVVPNMAEILLADDNAASATASAASSLASGTSSEDSNLESGDWANQPEDVLTRTFVSGVGSDRPAGNYSANHHAIKAAASAVASDGSATASAASSVTSDGFSVASSGFADNSEVSSLAAEDANLESEDWANQLEDVLTRIFTGGVPSNRGAGNYSALHYAAKAGASASLASTSETNAGNSASAAAGSEAGALDHLNAITGLSASALTLVAGSSASASYNSSTGVLTLGIPIGNKGDRGDPFNIDASGPIAGRSAYDTATTGFSYLSTDEVPTQVYFKNSDTSGDWSVGVGFGKGDTGDTGPIGLGWYSGNGVPGDGLGSDGELYLDLDNGDVYDKSGGTWGTASSNLAAGINDAIVSDSFTFSSAKTVELLREKAHINDFASDYVVTGLLPATDVSLTSSISAGTAYIIGKRTVKASTPNTYTASRDTYVDLANDGTYTFVEVANGAGAPAITASTVRVAKVVTDGSVITSVEDLRQLSMVIDGRAISTDGTKLDTIESGATADQSNAEIKVAYEANVDTNEFSDAEQSKLAGIATSANNYSHPNHTGDVTSTGDGATVIADDAVTYAKMQNVVSDNVILGNNAGADGVITELTAAEVRTLINVEDGATADQTAEEIQDIAGPLVATGGIKQGIDVTYDDANGVMDFVADVPSNKNILINAPMSIATRGVTHTAVPHGSYTLDRWMYAKAGSMVHTVTRDTDVPTLAQAGIKLTHSVKIDCTASQPSLAVGDFCNFHQRIEGLNFRPIVGVDCILGFWHKHTLTGTYCVAFRNTGNDKSLVQEYTQSVSDVWEYSEVALIATPSDGTWDYGTGIGLTVAFSLSAGTGSQTTAGAWQDGSFSTTANQVNACNSTSNDFRITAPQLESGTIATRFDMRPQTEELAMCQRYYQKSSLNNVGRMYLSGSSLNSRHIFVNLLTAMRVEPSVSFSVTSGTGAVNRIKKESFSVESVVANTTTLIDLTSYTADAEI